MTEQFFGKELAARKIEAIPGLMEFDIPVHGDNRGWFKENFQKEKMVKKNRCCMVCWLHSM